MHKSSVVRSLVVVFVVMLVSMLLTYIWSLYFEKSEHMNSLYTSMPEYYSAQGIATNSESDNTSNGLVFAQCSRACCSKQWQVPFETPSDLMSGTSEFDYVPTNITCSNDTQDAGCACLTKEQSQYLNSRGGNSDGVL